MSCPSVHPFFCLFTFPPVHRSIPPLFYPSIFPFIFLPVYLSISSTFTLVVNFICISSACSLTLVSRSPVQLSFRSPTSIFLLVFASPLSVLPAVSFFIYLSLDPALFLSFFAFSFLAQCSKLFSYPLLALALMKLVSSACTSIPSFIPSFFCSFLGLSLSSFV